MSAPINVNNQNVSVALTEGAQNFASDSVKGGGSGAKVDRDRQIDSENFVAKLLETGNNGEVSNGLLSDLISKAGSMGISLEPKVNKNRATGEKTAKEETAVTADTRGEKADATASTRNYILKVAKSNRDHSSGQGEGKDRGDYVQQVKEALVISYISFAANPVEKFLRKQGVNSLFLEMLADPKLDKDQAGEITDEAVAQARSELRAFIPEELENQLIKATLTQSEKFDDVVKLLKVAKQADFDAEKWINEVWPGRKEHQGLYVMDVPAEAVGLNVNVKNDQTDARNDRGKYEYKVEDEQDLALNRLRSLYMQMALGSQLTNRVATFFKMRKLKNGLIKLGVFTDQVDEKLQREGRALAKMKTIEMLEEGLHEEATFFDQGTAQSLVERKVKNCLKNLEKLGVTLSESEFGSLKSKAQKKILEIAKHELEVVRAQADSQLLGQREDMLVKLVTRLETDLGEPGMVSRLEISA